MAFRRRPGCVLLPAVKLVLANTLLTRISTCLLKGVHIRSVAGIIVSTNFMLKICIMEQAVPYLIIAGKSIFIYLFIILAIRIFGKKELAQLSVVDLVFILLISNSVQNAMLGNDNSLEGGLVAATGLFGANYLLKLLLHKWQWFNKAVQGEKIVLVHDGVLIAKGMREAQMSREELEMTIREHGVNSIVEVNLAILEVDGNVSILSDNYTQKTVRKRQKKQLSHNP
jgi:uncharacterized membrane protein YcaP (DUF421 family)